MRCLQLTCALLGSLLLATPAGAEAWSSTREGTTSTSTGAITNSTNADQIDDHIRADRQEERYRLEVEQCFGPNGEGNCSQGTGTEDNGRMRSGSARCFFQSSAPSTLVRADYDNSARASGNGTNALDDGRCWVDNDSMTLYVYDYTNTAWRPLLKTSGNLLYGGSFEQTDGTGNDSMAADNTAPPAGWTAATNGVVTYADAPASNGGGLYLSLTGAGGNDSLTQTLTAAGLKPSTTYRLQGRMYQTSGDTCKLFTSNGSPNAKLVTTADDTWQSVVGYFATNATPTAVTISARAAGDTDVCLFDRLAVYEMGDQANPPEDAIVLTANDSTTSQTNCNANYGTTSGCSDIAQVTVRVPGIGYTAHIDATASVDPNNASEECRFRIAKSGTTLVQKTFLRSATAHMTDSLNYTDGPLTANDTITYEMDVESSGNHCDMECDVFPCTTRVTLIPPR